MPDFIVTTPDGRKFRATGPNAEGARAAVERRLGGSMSSDQQPEISLVDALKKAPGSAWDQALAIPGAVADMVTNPGRTLQGINDLGQGVMSLGARPVNEWLSDRGLTYSRLPPPNEKEAQQMEMARGVGREYAEDYGSWKGFKRHLADEPLNLVGDMATVASAGVGAAGKLGVIGNAARPASALAKQPWAVQRLLRGAAPKDLVKWDALGPEAMVMDATPSTVGLAQGASAAPTLAKDLIYDSLLARDKGKVGRLQQGTRATLGKAHDPGSVKELIGRRAERKYAPMYKAAKDNAPNLSTPAVDNILLNKLVIPAEKLAPSGRKVIHGVLDQIDDALGAGTPKLTAERLHNIRINLDNAIVWDKSDIANLSSADKVSQTALKEARRGIDEILKTIPGFSGADAVAHTAAKAKEAVDLGFSALEGGKYASTPERFARQASKLPSAYVNHGMKADIRTAMGTQANDLAALRKKVGGDNDFNRDKIASQFGQSKVDDLVGMIDREGQFSQNYADIARNSMTAQRQAAASALGPMTVGVTSSATTFGLAASAAAKMVNSLLAKGATKWSNRNADALAKILTMKGPDGRAMLDEIISRSNDKSRARAILKSVSAGNITGLLGQPTVIDAKGNPYFVGNP